MKLHDITIAQINTRVGNVSGNAARVLEILHKQHEKKAPLVIFPELTLTGYPPEDLLLREDFVQRQTAAFEKLVADSAHLPAAIIGFVQAQHGKLFNALALVAEGRIVHVHRKNLLPNYGVFDERRYFGVGQAPVAFDFAGVKLGILVCEDAWQTHNARLLKAQGAQVIIIANASPFEVGKQTARERMVSETAAALGVPMIYANLVGGQDDLVFDGGSFAVDAAGNRTARFPAFIECVAKLSEQPASTPLQDDTQHMYQAAVLGTRDYVHKNGFSKAVLGLSGGVDSALVAAILADSLGPKNVQALLLPSAFTSELSNALARKQAEALGIEALTIPITPMVEAAQSALMPALHAPEQWRENLALGGNLQARLRGIHLMAYSNATGALLMNTSNKSELAVGYSTLYGDACGAFAPIRDAYKTQVYAMAQARGILPEIISRPPTAELKLNQRDDDQLPPYPVLDALLQLYIEEGLSAQAIVDRGFDAALVARTLAMVRHAEYKRRQFPPGTKLTSMHFYKDWRMPLTQPQQQ